MGENNRSEVASGVQAGYGNKKDDQGTERDRVMNIVGYENVVHVSCPPVYMQRAILMPGGRKAAKTA
jgi:hypothetical protein